VGAKDCAQCTGLRLSHWEGLYNKNHWVIDSYLTGAILNTMRRLCEILFGEQNVKYV